MSELKITHFTEPSKQAIRFYTANPEQLRKPISEKDIASQRIETKNAYSKEFNRSKELYCREVVEKRFQDIKFLQIIPKNLDLEIQEKVVLYFFGGGFIQGSPEVDLIVSAPLANELGVTILSPEYRLAPEHPFPCALEDCVAFYKHIIDQYGAKNVVLAGESSGGNLALSALNKAYLDGIVMPCALAAMSPSTDMDGDAFSADFIFQNDPALIPQNVDFAHRMYTPSTPKSHPLVSPHHATYGDWFPPVLFTTGTKDCFQHQVMKTAEKMSEAGVDVSLNIWQDLWHVFEFTPEIPEAIKSIQHIADFFRSHLK